MKTVRETLVNVHGTPWSEAANKIRESLMTKETQGNKEANEKNQLVEAEKAIKEQIEKIPSTLQIKSYRDALCTRKG